MHAISDFIYDSGSGQVNVTVSTSVYSHEVIHAATYKYTGSYNVLITPNTDDSVTVIFEAKEKIKDLSEDIKDFVKFSHRPPGQNATRPGKR